MTGCGNESLFLDTSNPEARFNKVEFSPGLKEALLYIVLVVTISKPPVELKEYFETACTGTMIRRDLVLTAASCLQFDLYHDCNPSNTMVYERSLGVLKALKIYIHPAFIEGKYYNYAAILVENSHQEEFPVLPKDPFDMGATLKKGGCHLGGYGKEGKSLPAFSNFKITKINDSNTYVDGYSNTLSQLIAVHFYDLIACSGDIGSPLICGNVLSAIFTPRAAEYIRDPRKCINRHNCYFAPVFPVMDWISRVMRAPGYSLDWMNNPWYILILCSGMLAIIGTIYYFLVDFMEKNFHPLDEEVAAPEEPLGDQISFSSTGTPRPKLRWSS